MQTTSAPLNPRLHRMAQANTTSHETYCVGTEGDVSKCLEDEGITTRFRGTTVRRAWIRYWKTTYERLETA